MTSFEENWTDEDDNEGKRKIECNSCGKAGLFWQEFDGRWKLVDRHSRIHVCANRTYQISLNKDTKL